MTKPKVAALAVASLLTLSMTLSACGASDERAVKPPEVKLTAKVPDNLNIGLIVSLSSKPGEGSEWLAGASGAQVATYQYQMGGHTVTLDVVDDKGTAAGATAAVASLASQKVSGIVAATTGGHLAPALKAAASAKIAVLLPYETNSAGLPANAWLTGPSQSSEATAVQAVLDAAQLSSPMVVTSPGRDSSGIDAATTFVATEQVKTAALLKEIRPQADKPAVADAVVVNAPAAQQAQIVRALQGSNLNVPIVLSRDAQSPVFAKSLADEGGALSGDMTSVGLDASDVTAVSAVTKSDGAASFFQALRLASSDSTLKDLFGQGTFRAQAGSADIPSHDAVVAIVAAATKAGSGDPAQVLSAFAGLSLGAADGLAGPALAFCGREAVAPGAVTAMKPTIQDPGVRPAGLGNRLQMYWFAVPTTAS